jgi:hypothetical protein
VFSDIYVLAGSGEFGVGIAATIPMFDDLLPPLFAPGHEPAIKNVSVPENRVIKAVVSIIVDLANISGLLQRLVVSPSILAFLFDSRGFLVAISNDSVPLVVNGSLRVIADIVELPLVVKTLSAIVVENNFSFVPNFFNRLIDLNGEWRVVTCQTYKSSDETISWTLVVVTPYTLYYGQAEYAKMLSLLICCLVIIPLVSVGSAILVVLQVARPARELALKMNRIADIFDFSARGQRKDSFVDEISSMQSAFDGMQAGISSFAKFVPLHIVKEIISSKSEAGLGVENAFATCFFSDIKDFTAIAEKESPSLLIMAVEEYFNAMSNIIEARNGIVGDYVG